MTEPRTAPEHLDDHELIDLCAALRWEPEGWLTHLEGCRQCRAGLGDLALVHGSFDPEAVPEPLIGQALAAARAAEPRAERWPAVAAPFTMIAVTAFAGLTVFAGINPLSAGGVLPAAVLAAVTAAAAVKRPSPGSPAGRLLAAL
jgi:hypothetical protein